MVNDQIVIEESCLSGRKSRTRNAVYALRRIGGSNPSLSANAVYALRRIGGSNPSLSARHDICRFFTTSSVPKCNKSVTFFFLVVEKIAKKKKCPRFSIKI